MERDQKKQEGLWKDNTSISVSYHKDLSFEVKAGSLIIVDEADTFIYNQSKDFSNLLTNSDARFLCMTATAKDTSKIEQEFIEFINLKVIVLHSDEEKQEEPLLIGSIQAGIEQFEKPTLIYGTEEQANTLISEHQYHLIKNAEILGVLDKLE
jgi:hypothetical protein